MPPEFTNVADVGFSSLLITPLIDPDTGSFTVKIDAPDIRIQPGVRIFQEDFIGEEVDPSVLDDPNEVYKDLLGHFAKAYKDKVKENIETQAFQDRWDALSEQYLDWKVKRGMDERTWIRTGQLLESIRSRYLPQIEGYVVGIDKTERYREVETIYDGDGNPVDYRLGNTTETRIIDVCRWLEYGVPENDLPPRPVWRPTKKQIMRNARNIYNDWLTGGV